MIVEPLHRCLPPVDGFLEGLRRVTEDNGILLIFDEVVTGFRLAYGGAQEYYGVVPDLVAYGKGLGGGYPVGAFGGRADIMELVREDRLGRDTYVWTASTTGGNPVSMAAARAVLRLLRGEGIYPRLHALGRYLRDGMERVLAERQQRAQVIGDGPWPRWCSPARRWWTIAALGGAIGKKVAPLCSACSSVAFSSTQWGPSSICRLPTTRRPATHSSTALATLWSM